MDEEAQAWADLDSFFERHHDQYKLSFGLEFSDVIGWVADITPRRGHPRSRDYPVWQVGGGTRAKAIQAALARARDEEGAKAYLLTSPEFGCVQWEGVSQTTPSSPPALPGLPG